MAFAYSRDINASSSIFNDVRGNQTNIANYVALPKALERLRKVSASNALYDSAYSSPRCYPGTREGIIGLISDWVSNPKGRGLCWLSGKVGTGKSAIAQTISRLCADEGRLAATFFCSRRDTDRSEGKKVISTIAHQLAGSFPSLKHPIRIAVENDPLIFGRAIHVQFKTLIIGPLIHHCITLPRMLVIIDALDECDEQSAQGIAELISSAVKTYDLPLQFLITSRPASHIEVPFILNHSIIKSFQLHDFDAQADIRLFLTQRFEEIYEDHSIVMRGVAKPWPSDDQMDRLMNMTRDLFIFASSIPRFVDDRSRSPDDRLQTILSTAQSNSSAYAELDQLYRQTLGQCTDTVTLRLILGTIISLQNPLPLPVIAILLRSQVSVGHLRAILQLLRSVLLVPVNEQEPVTTFHQSFRDFLTEKSRSGDEYCIDPEVFEVGLADSCLDLLNNSESLEPPSGMNRIALDYARAHYVSLLRRQLVRNGVVLDFFQLAACNVVALVVGALLRDLMNNCLDRNISRFVCDGIVSLLSLPISIVLSLPVIYLIADGLDHVGASIGVTAFCALEGGWRCMTPEGYYGIRLEPIIRAVTGGAPFDLVVRPIFGLETRVACPVPVVDVVGSVLRTITSGAVFDLLILATVWIFAVVVSRRVHQLTVPAMWMVGGIVGRGIGSALIASTDIIGAIQSTIRITFGLASSTLLFNFGDMHWMLVIWYREFIGILLACGELFFDRPIKETEMQADISSVVASHHFCRWTKARYYYALKRRRTPFSISAPFRDVGHVVDFYIMTLKPTQVSSMTRPERLFCDWCKAP